MKLMVTNEEGKVEPFYNKEATEHLVNQLIKLQQEYDNKGFNSGLMSKTEISSAMRTINKALKLALMVNEDE